MTVSSLWKFHYFIQAPHCFYQIQVCPKVEGCPSGNPGTDHKTHGTKILFWSKMVLAEVKGGQRVEGVPTSTEPDTGCRGSKQQVPIHFTDGPSPWHLLAVTQISRYRSPSSQTCRPHNSGKSSLCWVKKILSNNLNRNNWKKMKFNDMCEVTFTFKICIA